ncbi:MAG: hypothetical protein K2K19_01940, partial [Acetatifactor sp.]|nr:hypothetical protein [Acetatifactor sp.]
MRKNISIQICLLASVLLLSGCAGTEQPTDTAAFSQEPTTAPDSFQEQITPETPTGETTSLPQEDPAPDGLRTYLFDADITYQTMDGFGAAYTWYSNWVNYTDDPEEVMDALFSDAKITVLRFKNEYEYTAEDTAPNVYTMVQY